jgi:hypothetical protein
MAGVVDVDRCNSGRKFVGDSEGRGLVLLVGGNLGSLSLACGGDCDFVEVDLKRIERDRLAGLVQDEINRLVAIEVVVREVDVEGKGVVVRRRAAGKPLRERCTAGEQDHETCKHSSFHR